MRLTFETCHFELQKEEEKKSKERDYIVSKIYKHCYQNISK